VDFVTDLEVSATGEAIVAGGCFWGIDHYLRQIPGVVKVESGYTGGHAIEPTYQQVCRGITGHYEAVRVVYDKTKIDYYDIIKRFFEIHDPTQHTGQGPDIGQQYQSAIFYYNQEQLESVDALIQILRKKGYQVVTHVKNAQTFWPAESHHQDYYNGHGKGPYCHYPVNRFE